MSSAKDRRAAAATPLPTSNPKPTAAEGGAPEPKAEDGDGGSVKPPAPTRAELDAALETLPGEYKDADYVVKGMRLHFGSLFTDADEATVREKITGLSLTPKDGAGTDENDAGDENGESPSASPAPAVSLVPPAVVAEKEKEGGEPQVECTVPNAYNLVLSHDHSVRYEVGHAVMMPLSHAKHWFSEANGVSINSAT